MTVRVRWGREDASGGQSHSCVTAITSSPKPSAKRVSVALGTSDAILMSMSMARGMFVWAAVAAVFSMAVGAATAVAKPRIVKRTIGSQPGRPVPQSFAGLSIEYTSVPDYLGEPGKPNKPFIDLLRTLGSGGAGPPTLHIGGNSSDDAWWNPDGRPPPPGVVTSVTPAWLSMLRPVSDQARSRFVLGGNLALADPGNAVGFVQGAV